jgi:hypothetical protein
MKTFLLAQRAIGFALVALAMGCSSSSDGSNGLSFVALHPWDGGAEAGCAISASGVRVTCATAYRITGNPAVCAGFDDMGAGSTAACQAACMSGLACTLAGLSDGTNAVDCQAGCASPEH